MLQKSQKLPRTPYESSRDQIISACDELLKLVVEDGLAGHNEISKNVKSIKACFSDGNSQTEKHSEILELTQSIEQQLRIDLDKAENDNKNDNRNDNKNDNKNDNNSVKATGLVLQKIANIKKELKFIAIIETNIDGVLPRKREPQSHLEAEVPPILAQELTDKNTSLSSGNKELQGRLDGYINNNLQEIKNLQASNEALLETKEKSEKENRLLIKTNEQQALLLAVVEQQLAEAGTTIQQLQKDNTEEIERLKIELTQSQERLDLQGDILKVTNKNIETLQKKSERDQVTIEVLKQQISTLKQQVSAAVPAQQKPPTRVDDQTPKIEKLTTANAELQEQVEKLKSRMSEIEAAKQLATEKSDKSSQVNANLREQLNDKTEKIESLEIVSRVDLENAMAKLAEIKELKEQISNMEAAEKLATSSSANMANIIRELKQREQRLAAENATLKKQLSKLKPTTAAPLSFRQRPASIPPPPITPDALSELESPLSITLVTPRSPILKTKPKSPPITETPTLPSRFENIGKELETVTPTVSGGGRVVNIEQIQKDGEKDTDRPYFDMENTKQIKLGEAVNDPLKKLFDAGTLQFSDQNKPNKITFSNESMEPSDLQAMVAILQATSKDNKEPTLNNVEVILTGKDKDLIQVLQQFHAKLAAAVQGNDDEKICAIKIQDKGGHSEELTYLIKLHNAAANIIHNNTEEGLTADKKNNILKEIKALQEKATQLLASNPTDHRSHHPTLS